MIHKKQFRCILVIYFVSGFLFQYTYAQTHAEKDKTLSSQIMNREMNYSIVLPENYYATTDSFSVVYLLHGFGGDHNSWLLRCRINELVDSMKTSMDIRDFIYIMPDAENSYFINNHDSSYMISDYLSLELVPTIDSLYRTKSDQHSRAIMGLSMGGYGAIINAIKHHDQFGSVVALSAAVRNESIFKNLPQNRYEKYFGRVYGPRLSDTTRITEHWKEYSPYTLIDTNLVKELRTVNWYIDCGLDDFLLPANEAFHQLLTKHYIPHEYHVRPGKHNWAYWYKSTVYGLLYLNEKLILL